MYGHGCSVSFKRWFRNWFCVQRVVMIGIGDRSYVYQLFIDCDLHAFINISMYMYVVICLLTEWNCTISPCCIKKLAIQGIRKDFLRNHVNWKNGIHDWNHPKRLCIYVQLIVVIGFLETCMIRPPVSQSMAVGATNVRFNSRSQIIFMLFFFPFFNNFSPIE